MRFITALLIAGAALAATASSALAGGWATTLLDPLPTRLEVGTSYTVGYWVLQHGSHVSQLPLGKTGLKLVDEHGTTVVLFGGTPLPEPAHYAAAIAIPHPGSWGVYGQQGPFGDYKVGSMLIPGGLTALATPSPMAMINGEGQPWTAIQPLFNAQPTERTAPAATIHTPVQQPVSKPVSKPGWSLAQIGQQVLLPGLVIAALLALVALRRQRRSRQPAGLKGA